jgi:hypothetical protein
VTALDYYGPSFEAMSDAIAPFVKWYPLLRDCRGVQIA